MPVFSLEMEDSNSHNSELVQHLNIGCTYDSGLPVYKCCTILELWDLEHSISEEKMGYIVGKK